MIYGYGLVRGLKGKNKRLGNGEPREGGCTRLRALPEMSKNLF